MQKYIVFSLNTEQEKFSRRTQQMNYEISETIKIKYHIKVLVILVPLNFLFFTVLQTGMCYSCTV